MSRKVVIALNTAWNLWNFRSGLIRALVAEGYEVVAVAPLDDYAARLEELGCRYVSLHMENTGTHPGRDLMLWWRFYRMLRRERPDVFLGYTVKPNVYGSLAAHALGIPVVNNIAGLGVVFIKGSWLTRLVRGLYRLALGRSTHVFFQNEDDRRLFIEGGLVRAEVTDRVPGSGIDLQKFSLVPPHLNHSPERRSNSTERFRFLLIARMLWDKGVGEYVEAARQVRLRWPEVEFCLLGFLDVLNPAAISRAQMKEWEAEGVIHYLGVSDDVRLEIAETDCVVLPSFYREGVPHTLLEAAAMGRPIITTDEVGCREVVDDGLNGYLCKVRDTGDLVRKMEMMLALNAEERAEMGRYGRNKMEQEFDEQIVIDRYLEVVAEICARH